MPKLLLERNLILKDKDIPEHEQWVYDPANKHIVEHIKEGLEQKATKNGLLLQNM